MTVREFMARAEGILSGRVIAEKLTVVGRLLATAAREPGFVPEAELRGLHGGDSAATLVRVERSGLTLMLGRFSAREETPIHDHGSWGIACVVQGRDRYRHWERLDDGSRPGRAQIRVLYEKELGPGDWVSWLDRPADIHSQQGLREPALELVLFGKNVLEIPRQYFDADSGAVRTALPQ
jgi:predicted metal-dependent enzyme (double-stranded beta helix superfamily)